MKYGVVRSTKYGRDFFGQNCILHECLQMFGEVCLGSGSIAYRLLGLRHLLCVNPPNTTPDQLEAVVSGAAILKGIVLKARHVAEAALFLASDESAYTTGHNLMVDSNLPSFYIQIYIDSLAQYNFIEWLHLRT
ncbi:hypothetical protein Droror1_Dr00019455 [Drosera rotundifolia]